MSIQREMAVIVKTPTSLFDIHRSIYHPYIGERLWRGTDRVSVVAAIVIITVVFVSLSRIYSGGMDLFCGEVSGVFSGDSTVDFSSDEVDSWPDVSIASLIEDERHFVPGLDYLSRFHSRFLDASAREESVAWILKVQAYYKFQPLTAYLAVNYMDRFLYVRRLPRRERTVMGDFEAIRFFNKFDQFSLTRTSSTSTEVKSDPEENNYLHKHISFFVENYFASLFNVFYLFRDFSFPTMESQIVFVGVFPWYSLYYGVFPLDKFPVGIDVFRNSIRIWKPPWKKYWRNDVSGEDGESANNTWDYIGIISVSTIIMKTLIRINWYQIVNFPELVSEAMDFPDAVRKQPQQYRRMNCIGVRWYQRKGDNRHINLLAYKTFFTRMHRKPYFL